MNKIEIKNKVEYLDINKLTLLNNNPRTIDKNNFEKLKKSIQNNPDYFEARPLIVSDRTNKLIIIAGNQRYKASKELKLKQVPCVILHNLTEDKEREIIIRDNVELGNWDYDILANEWNVDELVDWGVDIPNLTFDDDIEEEDYKADESIYKLNDNCYFPKKNKYCIPEIREDMLYDGELPEDVIYGKKDEDIENKNKVFLSLYAEGKVEDTSNNNIIAFYTDDYKFESVWNDAVINCERFKNCHCRALLSPDFSVWKDQPLPYQIMARYKSNWCARYWQEFGLKIIPSLNWGGKDSYDFTFLGIPENAPIVAVQMGTVRTDKEIKAFFEGLNMAYELLKFKKLLIYRGVEHKNTIDKYINKDIQWYGIRSRSRKKSDLGLM